MTLLGCPIVAAMNQLRSRLKVLAWLLAALVGLGALAVWIRQARTPVPKFTLRVKTYNADDCELIPPVEQWTKWMNEAPADRALGQLRHAQFCHSQNVKNQQWGVLIGIAEQILKARLIQF